MAVRFQLRRDTAANWASANSVLALGEPGVETDTLKVKVGDGSTAWNSLAYSITKDFTDLTSKPSTLAGYGITDALALSGLSVTQNAASGNGTLTYNNATGVFSYTPPNFEGLNGNFTGSVFADDSTIMVDGVSATLNLANNSITDLSDADQTVRTTDDVTFNSVTGNIVTSQIDSGDSSAIEIQTDVTMLAGLTVGNHILPSSNENIDLGSATNRFRELYLSGNTISLDSVKLSSASGALLVHDGAGNRSNIQSHNIDANDITANDVTAAGDVDVTGNLTMTGYIAGPATFTIDPAAVGDNTGTLVIAGNLQVDGTTTTINSQTLEVEDKNVVLGPNAANDAANNGAGITVTQPDTSDASLIYNTTDTQWELNKKLDIAGKVTSTDIDILSNNPRIRLDDSDTDNNAEVTLDNTSLRIEVDEDDAIADSLIKFRVDADTKAVITSTGRLGIGYESPSNNIHILGSDASPNVGITLQSDDTANATATLTLMARDASNVNQTVNIQNTLGRLNIDANMDVIGVGTNFKSASYNILNLQTDTDDNGSSDDGIFKITNGSAGTTKAEFRWDESEDLVHVSYGDHGRHISINSSGNVGIGTSSVSPTELLEVAGNVKAEQYLLDAIDASISDTAVDVFVYDTRKDSDGGAWRKRTQHTSWYNETLNTATRGARKEFPSVAVIVAEATQLTIYDGDDPDMPMWMVFNQAGAIGSASNIITANSSVTSLACVNGTMCFGMNDSSTPEGTFTVNFVSELSRCYRTVGSGYTGSIYTGSVSTRNSNKSYEGDYDLLAIVSQNINDVAMTVLPNAPIDSATGLPEPTIAVATNGGVSVIKDDGTVVDYVGTSQGSDAPVDKISFIGSSRLLFSHRYASEVVNLASSDDSAAYYNQLSSFTGRITNSISHDDDTHVSALSSDNNIESIALNQEDAASKSVSGLSLANHYQVTSDPDRVSCFITSDYNTGWMHGDIKLATLSDTRTTSLSGTNRCAADNFSSGWTVSTGSNMSIGSNVLAVVDTSNTGASFCDQTITTIVGQEYVIDVTATGTSGTGIGLYVTGYGGPVLGYQWEPTYSFTATTTSTVVRLYRFEGHTGSGTITSVIIKEAASDRSVNGSGVSAFGTVTKTAVATGAELVGYSGFSASNYLAQPYNSNLAYGTGDFCYTLWIKKTGTAFGYIFDRANGDGGQRVTSYFNNGATISSYTNDGAINDVAIPNGSWFQLVQLRVSGTMKVYINGVLKGSVGTSTNLSGDSNVQLKIGVRFNSVDGLTDGSISLFRSSATAPSPEQIAKIYNDEKHLFQENAKATLYGSSDAVTALAYDDDTELLHVGTSAGRSVFQGLRRVDNTTDAVGAAISASNGLVAED